MSLNIVFRWLVKGRLTLSWFCKGRLSLVAGWDITWSVGIDFHEKATRQGHNMLYLSTTNNQNYLSIKRSWFFYELVQKCWSSGLWKVFLSFYFLLFNTFSFVMKSIYILVLYIMYYYILCIIITPWFFQTEVPQTDNPDHPRARGSRKRKGLY